MARCCCCCCWCRQNSVLQLGPDGHLQVLPSLPADAPCPPLDIAFPGEHRGVGHCTDVALYVIHAGARVIPLLQGQDMQQYNARCANRTARMFLETMYREWHSPGHESLHVMQVCGSCRLVFVMCYIATACCTAVSSSCKPGRCYQWRLVIALLKLVQPCGAAGGTLLISDVIWRLLLLIHHIGCE
jgi:hypothetical protein